MNNEQIEELKKLAEAATPGPWATDDPWVVYAKIGAEVVYLANTSQLDTTRTQYPKDAAYIAAANPAAVLELIEDRNRQERMFLAACDALAAIADDLGIDSHIEGGAAPILREIAALRAAQKS